MEDKPLVEISHREERLAVADVVARLGDGRLFLASDSDHGSVWDRQKRSRLVQSLLMRLPIPQLYVAAGEPGRWVVVDGWQRLATLRAFFEGTFELDTPDCADIDRCRFADLGQRLQTRLEACMVQFVVLDQVSAARRIELFERINGAEVVAVREQMTLIEAQSQQSAAVRDAFLARMSHELRTPLNAILGYAEMLQDDMQGTAAEDLSRLRSAALNLLAIVTAVMDLTQLQSGSYELSPEPVPLLAMLRKVEDAVRLQAESNGNVLKLSAPANLIGILDRRMIHSILYNLVSNGCKYTMNGRVTADARLEDDRILLVVTDNGIGLTERQLREAFRPFSQADESSTRRYDGAGLGLAVVRGFAEAMGGSVTIESTPGKGATVTVELPRVVERRSVSDPGDADDPTIILR